MATFCMSDDWNINHDSIGTNVAAYFSNVLVNGKINSKRPLKLYSGKVTKYASPQSMDDIPLYHIFWEDGDEQDYDEKELQDGMNLFQEQILSKNSNKKHKVKEIVHNIESKTTNNISNNLSKTINTSSKNNIKVKNKHVQEKICVRCNQSYSSTSNTSTRCEIEHKFWKYNVEGGEMIEADYGRCYTFTYQCCGKKYLSDSYEEMSPPFNPLEDQDFCFFGSHEDNLIIAKAKEEAQIKNTNKIAKKNEIKFYKMITNAEKQRKRELRAEKEADRLALGSNFDSDDYRGSDYDSDDYFF